MGVQPVASPMQGTVVSIDVAEGDTVRVDADDGELVFERAATSAAAPASAA